MRNLKKLVMLAAVLMLNGCASNGTPIVAIDTSCGAFKNITYSRKDTRQTKREIKEHNAVYDELCK